MSTSLSSLIEAWGSLRTGRDPYEAVDRLAYDYGKLWPYAVAYEQIESGWLDPSYVGALALNLSRAYEPKIHGIAAFITLSCKWPASDTTAALNLLGLAHRVSPSSHPWLDRLLAHASVECLKAGLSDQRAIVSEEAANVLGGMGSHHLVTANEEDIGALKKLAYGVLERIDLDDIVSLLGQRIEQTFDTLPDRRTDVPGEVGAHQMVREIESCWPSIASASKDADPLAALKSHVAALAWRFENHSQGAVQAVYVYSDKNGQAVDRGWTVVEPWSTLVRGLLIKDQADKLKAQGGPKKVNPPKPPAIKVAFTPFDAMAGSLLVTLQVETEASLQEDITRTLRAAKVNGDQGIGDLDTLRDLLRDKKLRVRVAHVEADGDSASLAITPTEEPAKSLYSSKKLKTADIPQANELGRIFTLVDLIAEGKDVTPEGIGVTSQRQVQYYTAAARILDLVVAPERLSRLGWLLHVAEGSDRYRRIRAAFEASPCGQSWIEWASVTKLSDIPADSAADFLTARSDLSGDTVSRRANTLNVWLKELRTH